MIRFPHQMAGLSLASWGSFPLPRLSYQESDIGFPHPHVCNGSMIAVVSIILLLLSGYHGYLYYEKAKSDLDQGADGGATL